MTKLDCEALRDLVGLLHEHLRTHCVWPLVGQSRRHHPAAALRRLVCNEEHASATQHLQHHLIIFGAQAGATP